MQLGSQVKLIDANDSLIWEEQFVEPAAKYVSSQLEAVWWMPSNNCETKFIISNTTDAPYSDLYLIDIFMPRLYQFSDPNKQVLEQKAFEAVQAWRREQDLILQQRNTQGEIEAHAISDPIAPRYVFQIECQPYG